MPGQSGLNEINAGNTAINDGKACDRSPQAFSVHYGERLQIGIQLDVEDPSR
jgi:hypothetical protein